MQSNKPFRSYGLIKKNAEKSVLSTCVFDDTDDSEQQGSSKNKSSFECGKVKKETRLNIEKALVEDPTIFEYDSVYDSFKNEKKIDKATTKNARYLPTLLQAAEKRKKEQERRLERKIQKEREEEGDEFQDKEAFVTTAYKEKLIEMEAENEKEIKEKQLEELRDVKKQNDLSGFYRHLLHQQTTESSTDTPTEKPTFNSKKVNRNLRSRERSSSESSCSSPVPNVSESNDSKFEKSASSAGNKRQTRKRDSDEVTEEKDDEENNRNKETRLIVHNESKNENISEQNVDNTEYLIALFTKRTVGEIFEEKKRQYLLRKQSRIH